MPSQDATDLVLWGALTELETNCRAKRWSLALLNAHTVCLRIFAHAIKEAAEPKEKDRQMTIMNAEIAAVAGVFPADSNGDLAGKPVPRGDYGMIAKAVYKNPKDPRSGAIVYVDDEEDSKAIVYPSVPFSTAPERMPYSKLVYATDEEIRVYKDACARATSDAQQSVEDSPTS